MAGSFFVVSRIKVTGRIVVDLFRIICIPILSGTPWGRSLPYSGFISMIMVCIVMRKKNAKNDQFVLSARKITLKNLPHPDDDGGTRGLGAAKQSQKKG